MPVVARDVEGMTMTETGDVDGNWMMGQLVWTEMDVVVIAGGFV